MSDKCPWCDSENWYKEADWLGYDCGTYRTLESGSLVRSKHCEIVCQIARMQPVVDALGKYIRDLRGDASGMAVRWLVVSDAWDKYEEGE